MSFSELFTKEVNKNFELKDWLPHFSTQELVDELRKREGVDAYDVSADSDSRIILYGHGTDFVDTGTEKGPAIILRIIDSNWVKS